MTNSADREWVVVDTGDNEFTGIYRNGVHVATVRAPGEDHYRSMLATGVASKDIGFFVIGDEVYEEVLDGAGYPDHLTELPLDRCDNMAAVFGGAYR